MEQKLKQYEKKFDLQYRISTLEQELAEQNENLKYAIYEKREADARVREYQGSIKSLLHRLSGKGEDEKEQLTRETRDAASRLEAAKQKLAMLEHRMQETKGELEQIPEIPDSDDPQWKQGSAKIKARYLLKITLPLPDETVQAMEIARGKEQPQLRWGSTWGSIANARYQPQEYANNLAKTLRGKVEELNECLAVLDQPPVELGPYFYSPEAYLVTAFQYGTLDQMNKAMDQVMDCRRALNDLQNRLE